MPVGPDHSHHLPVMMVFSIIAILAYDSFNTTWYGWLLYIFWFVVLLPLACYLSDYIRFRNWDR